MIRSGYSIDYAWCYSTGILTRRKPNPVYVGIARKTEHGVLVAPAIIPTLPQHYQAQSNLTISSNKYEIDNQIEGYPNITEKLAVPVPAWRLNAIK